MKRSAPLLTSFIIFVAALVPALGQGMAANPPASPPPLTKITAASVWQPPPDFLGKAHSVCDKSMSAVSFPECFMNQIAAAGAPSDAVAFTRMLYRQNNGDVGIMAAFKTLGKVDMAQVFYPLRANTNYGLLLVNGDPKILDVDDLKKLDQAAMEQNPKFSAMKKKYPQTDIWPGDRSGSNPWPRTRALSGGGTEFIVTYPLINGCHACERVGVARFGWEFDASGKFLKTVYLSVLPSKGAAEPRPPSASSPARQ